MLDDSQRVVVTGLGTINPIGDTAQTFWKNLKEGKNGIQRITLFDPKDYHTDFAGEVSVTEAHYNRFKSRKMARRFDRYILFNYLSAQEALNDADIQDTINARPERYASLLSSGSGGTASYSDAACAAFNRSMDHVHPLSVINSINSTGAGYFAQMHNLQGPSFAISSACSSSNYSFAIATQLIKSGLIDGAIAGGAEASVCEIGVASFGNIYALSRRKSDFRTASRPFDKDRDGFVIGEGAGVLCLERLDIAKKRGANIYCEITGFGWSCDAHDIVAPRADGLISAKAIQMSLDQARLDPTDIDLINAHATSTPLGDVAEYRAVKQVFGAHADTIPIHSTKSLIGHLLGGAAGVSAVAIAMVFKEGYAHHTINQFEQDPDIKFNVIVNDPLKMRANHVLSNSFAFGGQNATIVFSRFNK